MVMISDSFPHQLLTVSSGLQYNYYLLPLYPFLLSVSFGVIEFDSLKPWQRYSVLALPPAFLVYGKKTRDDTLKTTVY